MPANQKRISQSTLSIHPMVHASAPTPLPVHCADASHHGLRVHERGLYLGTDADSDSVYLVPEHLQTHLHVLGATGTGKSRFLFWLFQLLCHTNRPIVLIDPKGGLYELARNYAMLSKPLPPKGGSLRQQVLLPH